MEIFELHFFDHLIMLTIGVILPILSIISSRQSLEDLEITPDIKKHIYLNNSLVLWGICSAVLAVWIISGRELGLLGFRKTEVDSNPLWIYMLGLFLLFYFFDLFSNLFSNSSRKKVVHQWKKLTPFMPANWREFIWFIPVAITAGFCEEVIFRGYMINYLLVAFDNQQFAMTVAVTLPAIIFGVSHAYQGPKAIMKVVLMALLFGYIFILTGSIVLLIILHVLVDLIGGYAGVKLLSNQKNEDF